MISTILKPLCGFVVAEVVLAAVLCCQCCCAWCRSGSAQRAKFAKKVHKPPLRVNVINFELGPQKAVMHWEKYSNS